MTQPAIRRRELQQRFTSPLAVPATAAPLRAPLPKGLETLPSTVDPPPFPDAADPVLHLLNRITFGFTPAELARARAMGYNAYLEEQLNPELINDSAVDQAVASLWPTTTLTAPQIWLGYKDESWQVVNSLNQATLYRQLFSKRQLKEVMVEFWNVHFSIYHWKNGTPWLKTVDDRDVIRAYGMSRFKKLLRKSAKSPAMLDYLDNVSNVADGPNENYARELMELHSLGVNGGYTQQDVVEVARCFTGWTYDYEDATWGTYHYDPDSHDNGPKTVFGTAIPAGGGKADGKTVLLLLAAHPSTAQFISFKLCRRFISDVPPPAAVAAAAATFTATGGDIRSVLRTILNSPEFLASDAQKLKRPIEVLTSCARTMDYMTVTPDAMEGLLYWLLGSMGQVPFEWEPPNGYPEVAAAWANTNGILARWNTASAMGMGWPDGVDINFVELVRAYPQPRTVTGFVDYMLNRVLHRAIQPADRTALIQYVADGNPPDAPTSRAYLEWKAHGLLAALYSSSYFQFR